MVDVPRIPGTSGPSDQFGGKDKSRVEGDKFKDLMKIDKTDPDLQKKRKRREEAEAEKKAKNLSAPIPKERNVGHFEKIREQPKITKVGESQKDQPSKHKRPEESPPEASRADRPARSHREKTSTVKAESNPQKETGEKKQSPPVEEVIEEALTPTETPFIPQQEITPPSQKIAKKEETSKPVELPTATPPGAPAPSFLPAASSIPAPSAILKPEMFELFEKLVSVISVMHTQGISETTIHLNTPAFANSIFAGAQIVIREYSTAPKVFNIEFQGNAQNIALFNANVADLMAAFQSGRYNFQINRIDTSLLAAERADKPLFHRKEKPGDKDMEGGEGETR